MCGITIYLIHSENEGNMNYKSEILKSSKSIRHRGPDWSGIQILSPQLQDNGTDKSVLMAHERLAIVDPQSGGQPFVYQIIESKTGKMYNIVLCVNGEIYNYKDIRSECPEYDFKTDSDCEVIIALYLKFITENETLTQSKLSEVISQLDGQFSFTLYDEGADFLLVGRDPIGITSLYYGFDEFNNFMICSELKGLHLCDYVETFPTGSILALTSPSLTTKENDFQSFDVLKESRELSFQEYYKTSLLGKWIDKPHSSMETYFKEVNESEVYATLRDLFTKSVEKRLMADVPFGVLLSGGLDSSLVASITCKLVKEGKVDLKWGEKIHSFSIGLIGDESPDSLKAIEAAKFLGTIHHDFRYTIQEGLDALRDVIWHLETYDITTIRASTPMFLISRKIKAMGVKMVLSGEGADELLGGYLYFLSAPSEKEFYEETQRRVKELGYFDCLRANKSTLGWGLEGRVPFLDKEFIDYCFKIPPGLKCKNGIEKYVMRKAFDVKDKNNEPIYLPDSILWRQKEQFSDGVGYGWIDAVRDLGEKTISDEEFSTRAILYPINTPHTKEAFMFRKTFEELFPKRANTVKKWIPKTEWEGVGDDPSGRAQKVHTQSY
jgi:asparagine synthase (glutamine-hydrolysing)